MSASKSATERANELCVRLAKQLHARDTRHFGSVALTQQQVAHIEHRIGHELPVALKATWQHAALMACIRTVGSMPALDEFFEPMPSLQRWRANVVMTYELRDGAARLLQDDSTLDPSQAVRHDAWNRGWFPLGKTQNQRVLYLDWAPGPAGRVGQIIEAQGFYAAPRPAVAAANLVAVSWLEYLECAVHAWESRRIARSADSTAWAVAATGEPLGARRLVDLCAREIALEELQDESELESTPAGKVCSVVAEDDARVSDSTELVHALATALLARLQPMPTPLRQEAIILWRRPLGEHSYRDEEINDALSRFRQWAGDRSATPCALLAGYVGSGRSTLLAALAEPMLRATANDPSALVPLLIDLRRFAQARSLTDVLDAYVESVLGTPGKGAALLRHVHAGRCLLLLDNVETLLAAGHDAWVWVRSAMPEHEPTDLAARSGARVLVSLAIEAAADVADLAHALASIAPGWVCEQDLGLRLRAVNSTQAHAWLSARIADAAISAEDYRLTQRLCGETDMPQQAWETRPAWLDHVFGEASAAKLRDSRNTLPDWRSLIHGWSSWVTSHHAAHGGELSNDELHHVAEQVALQMWASADPSERSDDNRRRCLPWQDVLTTVRALRPDSPAAVERASWQVRLDLTLFCASDGQTSFTTFSTHIAVIARMLALAARAGEYDRFVRVLAMRPMDAPFIDALMGACDLNAAASMTRALDHAFAAAGDRDHVIYNVRAIGTHWNQAVSDTPGRELRGLMPALALACDKEPFQGRGGDFSGRSFADQNLRGAVFDGARLDGCNFSGACLAGASMRNASARDAHFGRADATGLQASGLSAPGSVWMGARLDGAVMTGANLGGAWLRHTKGTLLDGSGVDLTLARVDEQFARWEADAPKTPPWIAEPPDAALQWRAHWDVAPALGPRSLCYSHDGATLAVAHQDGRVAIWHTAIGARVRIIDTHLGAALGLVFLPDGCTLVCSHLDGTVHLWNVRSGRHVRSWGAHDEPVCALHLSDDGQWLLTGGLGGRVRRWRMKDPQMVGDVQISERRVLRLHHAHENDDCAWVSLEGGGLLFVCWSSGETQALEALAGCRVVNIQPAAGYVIVLTYSDDGARVLRVQGNASQQLLHRPNVLYAQLSADSSRLIVAAHGGQTELHNLRDGAVQSVGHDEDPCCLAFSPDGRQAVVAKRGGLQLIDVATGAGKTAHLWPASGARQLPHWMPDGQGVLCRDLSHGTSCLIDARSGAPIEFTPRSRELLPSPHVVGLDRVGHRVIQVVDASKQSLDKLDWAQTRWISAAEIKRPGRVAFSSSGRHLACGFSNNTSVHVWSLPEGNVQPSSLVMAAIPSSDLRCIACAEGGAWLAIGLGSGEIILLDMAAGGSVRQRWQAHYSDVSALALVGDDTRLLSFSPGDSQARLWDVRTGALANILLWTQGAPTAAQVGPGGHVAVIGNMITVIDAAELTAANMPTLAGRFQVSWAGQDNSAMVLHADGRYSAYGRWAFKRGLRYEVTSPNDEASQRWPRYLDADQAQHLANVIDPTALAT